MSTINVPLSKKVRASSMSVKNVCFHGSDGYILTITFPLKDCPENLAIFGHIDRANVVAQKVIFDCEIRDRGFYKFGSITITENNEAEVKTQFLEGRSEQNFDKTFDKVYINELDLGSYTYRSISQITPTQDNCAKVTWFVPRLRSRFATANL